MSTVEPGRPDESVAVDDSTTDAPAPAGSDVPDAIVEEEQPEQLRPKTWLTLVLFAAFIVAVSSCTGFFGVF